MQLFSVYISVIKSKCSPITVLDLNHYVLGGSVEHKVIPNRHSSADLLLTFCIHLRTHATFGAPSPV